MGGDSSTGAWDEQGFRGLRGECVWELNSPYSKPNFQIYTIYTCPAAFKKKSSLKDKMMLILVKIVKFLEKLIFELGYVIRHDAYNFKGL